MTATVSPLQAAALSAPAGWLATTTRPLFVALGTVDSEGPPTADGGRSEVAFREIDRPGYRRARVRLGSVETIAGHSMRRNRNLVEFDRSLLSAASDWAIVTKRSGKPKVVAFGELTPAGIGESGFEPGDMAILVGAQ